jgi:hypothetical protein
LGDSADKATEAGEEVPRIKKHDGRTAPVIRQDNWGGWSMSRQGPSSHISLRTVSAPEIAAVKKMSVSAGMMEFMPDKAWQEHCPTGQS